MKWFILVTLLLISSVFVLKYFFSDGLKTEIQNEDFQYSTELGWINWKHAYPKGTIESFENFQKLNKAISDSFSFTYSQKMKLKFGNTSLVAEYKECRNIKSNLTLEQEQLVFLDVFKSVSTGFEKMQGKLPYNTLSDSKNSSFREGDLMGNLLSYYCAISNVNLKEIKNNISLYDPELSLEKYQNGMLKKTEWDSVVIKNNGSNKMLSELQSIVNKSNEERKSLSRITAQSELLYWE